MAVLAGCKVDTNGIEIHAKFLKGPADADRSCRAELVQLYLHRYLLTCRALGGKPRLPVFRVCVCSLILERWRQIEEHDVACVVRHDTIDVFGAQRRTHCSISRRISA